MNPHFAQIKLYQTQTFIEFCTYNCIVRKRKYRSARLQKTRNKELTHECPPKHPRTGTPRIIQGKEIKEDTQEKVHIVKSRYILKEHCGHEVKGL